MAKWMRRTGVAAVRFVAGYTTDLLALAGCVLLLYGLAQWWVPAAWIVAGALLMAVAILPELRRRQP